MTAEILLVSDNEQTINEISEILKQHSYILKTASDSEKAEKIINEDSLDIVLYDCEAENIDILLSAGRMKLNLQSKNICSILLLGRNNADYNLLKYASCYITRPFDEHLFSASIASNLQMRNSLKELSKNNSSLAKSLYQLNVLYTAGMQLSEPSASKGKLIDIAMNALDQSLSLSLSYALVLSSANDIKLIIKSLFPISDRLENAIKIRAILNYKNEFSLNPNETDIIISKFSKDQFGEYDLNVFEYDNLSAKINIKNKFYGIVEVFREADFSSDDAKCFSALINQASPPLEGAVLYEEIKEANERLKKLESLKSEFISIVSHELKTPLTSINSSLDIILKGMTGEVNSAAEKFLNLAKANTKRLEAIIGDLLDLSKIEAGKMEFHFEKTNINLPAAMVKNSLENLAKERSITINLNLDNNLENVYIDTQRIEQVLTNLISNALKFTPENGVIEVSSSKITEEDLRKIDFFKQLPEHLSREYVQIKVKDSGIGIAKENWSRIFEQFRQIENPSVRKTGGTGLGLPISKRLIDAHKGFIWLESTLNQGTAFYIALPVMNDKEIFELSLEQDIIKAKQDKINIALFSLCEKIIEGKSLIDKILQEEIIRKTSVYKDYFKIENGKRYYYSYALDIDSFAFDFEKMQLENYIKAQSEEYSECTVQYSSVLYPQEGKTAEDLIEKLNSFSKGDIDEKDTDS